MYISTNKVSRLRRVEATGFGRRSRDPSSRYQYSGCRERNACARHTLILAAPPSMHDVCDRGAEVPAPQQRKAGWYRRDHPVPWSPRAVVSGISQPSSPSPARFRSQWKARRWRYMYLSLDTTSPAAPQAWFPVSSSDLSCDGMIKDGTVGTLQSCSLAVGISGMCMVV